MSEEVESIDRHLQHDEPLVVVAPCRLAKLLAGQVATLSGVVVSIKPPPTGRSCRFETKDGQAIDLPESAIRFWERPPYVMCIRLVDCSPCAHVMAEAVIGTRSGLRALQDKIIATMRVLLRGVGPTRLKYELEPPRASTLQLCWPPSAAFWHSYLRHFIHRWQDRLFVERWSIGTIKQTVGALVEGEPLQRIDWIAPETSSSLADPHPWPGTSRILCEEFSDGGPLDSTLGRILSISLDHDCLNVVEKKLVIGKPFHRSYPGAVVYGSDVLFLPETPVRGQTVIYRLRQTGVLDEVCQVAPHLRMADPTLFWHGGRAWIAYSDLDFGEHDNLCLLYADDVYGPWYEHDGNPVKIDVRSARPAGPVFVHQNVLYRPAQDCARSYGAAVVLNRIDVLTTAQFKEVAFRRIEPDANGPYPHGLHTLSTDGDRLFIDGKRRRFDFHSLSAKIRRRVESSFPGVLNA